MYIIENVWKLRRKRSMMQANVKQRCARVQASRMFQRKLLMGEARVRVSGRKAPDCRILKVAMMSWRTNSNNKQKIHIHILIHILIQSILSAHTI